MHTVGNITAQLKKYDTWNTDVSIYVPLDKHDLQLFWMLLDDDIHRRIAEKKSHTRKKKLVKNLPKQFFL